MQSIWVVVPAAGRGQRFGAVIPKQYAPLVGQPMLVRTLDRLLAHPQVAGAMVALAKDDPHWPGFTELEGKPVRTCFGGEERADSVLAGLKALAGTVAAQDWVLVHDAARPCVRHHDLDALIEQGCRHADGAILAAPVRDTMKRGGAGGRIEQTLPRDELWRALTPQLFRYGALVAALEHVLANPQLKPSITDEASAIEAMGGHPLLVVGDDDNIKVTTLHDLALAEFILTSPS